MSSESLQAPNAAPINWSILKNPIWGFPWHGESFSPAHGKKRLPHHMEGRCCLATAVFCFQLRTSCHVTPRASSSNKFCFSYLLKHSSHLHIAEAVSACQPSETRDFQTAPSFGSSALQPITFRGEFSALFPLYSASQYLFQKKLPTSCVPCTTHYPQAAKAEHNRY